MGRRYTIEQYKNLFDAIKTKIPNCAFSTDIIVGFPNETQTQFQHTLDIVDYCRFDNAYTFIYSPRDGTPAANMQDNVDFQTKQERLAQLNEKVNHYAWENNQKYKDAIVSVLVDGPSKKNPNIYCGYTETNKLVNFERMDAKCGDIIQVKIVACKTWSLDGIQVKEK